MRLEAYREKIGKSRAQAAVELEVAKETLRRYELPRGHPGAAIPHPVIMVRIYVWSDGAVDPNSFYPLPDLAGLDTAA